MENERIDQLEQMLQETMDLAKENNRMLRSQQRGERMAHIGKIIKLLAIVVALVVGIAWLRPYIQSAQKIYESVSTQLETVSDAAQSISDTQDKASNFFSGFEDEFADLSDTFKNLTDKNKDAE